MVGTSDKHYNGPYWLSKGINMYSSYDLQHWHFEGNIFTNTSITPPPPAGTQYRIERAHIIYNWSTRMYVMYFHLDTENFDLKAVGVAVSKTVSGQYQFVRGYKPDGKPSLDFSLFQEQDGSAYLVRSIDNKYFGISRLTDDYMNTAGLVSVGQKCEGFAMWRDESTYYLWCTHLTGWAPNPAILLRASAPIEGANWTYLGNPSG